jgi:hypothetical protein
MRTASLSKIDHFPRIHDRRRRARSPHVTRRASGNGSPALGCEPFCSDSNHFKAQGRFINPQVMIMADTTLERCLIVFFRLAMG